MKRTDIPDLLRHLRSALAETTGISVALSGSLARGDFRARADGTISSDLDLIPIVPTPADVAAARAQLQPVLQSTADQFGITATAAITLQDRCLSVPRARYLTSMTAGPWLADPLDVAPRLAAASTAALKTIADDPDLPWLIQPITYYLAKATHEDPVTNIGKARTAATHLLGHLGHTGCTNPTDHVLQIVTAIRDLHSIKPLPSSERFLTTPTAQDVYSTVRDLVFTENQGIGFTASAMAATPRIPN
ncbi:hypothetical protein ACFRSX_35610 [Streptomyces goshikiensis]|uniref:hypothetical protein n=1 Tax=Streptomyces TaxID=1883 RepID=UPI00093D922E|nr:MULTISPECIES: hypothetical protein [unclassified Streptomyces]OKI36978.1 hypothetical protein A6A28_32945 [Streptomyces sp. CB03578]PJN17427.1 hypothetical protein CG724_17605 [Streptomyces sp. CB02120-2]